MRATRLLWCLVLAILSAGRIHCQQAIERSLESVAATPDGSLIVFAVFDANGADHSLIAITPATNRVAWRRRIGHIPTTLAISPGSQMLAAGFVPGHAAASVKS